MQFFVLHFLKHLKILPFSGAKAVSNDLSSNEKSLAFNVDVKIKDIGSAESQVPAFLQFINVCEEMKNLWQSFNLPVNRPVTSTSSLEYDQTLQSVQQY